MCFESLLASRVASGVPGKKAHGDLIHISVRLNNLPNKL